MQITLHTPQTWNELSTAQLCKIASLLNKKMKPKYFDIMVFFTLLNVKWYQLLKFRKVFIVLRYVSISTLKKHFLFIYNKTDLTNFIPVLKIKGNTLNAPAPRMHNITIDEFATADDLYLKFSQTQNIEYLRYLAAVLYYETDDKGKKLGFDKDSLDLKVEKLAKIKDPVLLAIGLSYQGSRTEIVSKYKVIFPEKNKVNKTKKKKKLETSGLGNIISSLTDGKIYFLQTVKNTNVHDFLADYQNKLIKSKKNAS